MNDVIVLPPAETALQVFTEPKGLDPYIKAIRAEVEGFVPDVTTKKGREQIASLAYKVAKSKTALESVGKDLAAKYKEIPKLIDAARKAMREELEALQEEVRAPLTAWENNEKARTEGIKSRIQQIFDLASTSGLSSDEIAKRIEAVDAVSIDSGFDEFAGDAAAACVTVRKALVQAHAGALENEAQQEELERLRKEQAERERIERERFIAEQAAQKAREEVEAMAKAEREAAARRELDLKMQAERAEREAEEARLAAEKAAKDAAEAANLWFARRTHSRCATR